VVVRKETEIMMEFPVRVYVTKGVKGIIGL
jgi:hypothetical protein